MAEVHTWSVGEAPQIFTHSSEQCLQLGQAVVVADAVGPLQVQPMAGCKVVVVRVAAGYLFRYLLVHQAGSLVGPGSCHIVFCVAAPCQKLTKMSV